MSRACFILEKAPYENGISHYTLRVMEGDFAALQGFYCRDWDVEEFGRELAGFPAIKDRVGFEVGERSDRTDGWVFLCAQLTDPAGHAALTVAVSNNAKGPIRREAIFSIRCEVASINRIGAMLRDWQHRSDPVVRFEFPVP